MQPVNFDNATTEQMDFVNGILDAMQNKDSLDVILSCNTVVKTAAAFKHLNVTKVSAITGTLNKHSVYTEQAINTALHNANNGAHNLDSIVNFQAEAVEHYTHLDTNYCIMQHKLYGTLYLYISTNSASSSYFIDGVPATKIEVMELLTPSAAKAMSQPYVQNKGNGFTHAAHVRTIKLSSIQSLTLLDDCASVLRNDSFAIA